MYFLFYFIYLLYKVRIRNKIKNKFYNGLSILKNYTTYVLFMDFSLEGMFIYIK